MAKKPVTFIQAAIPVQRGKADHIETDALAMTVYDGKGQVQEVHTPPQTLQRIHETLHARHSSGLGAAVDYPGINRSVAEIVEDCRLHLNYWPWNSGCAPAEIRSDIVKAINTELNDAKKSAKSGPPNPYGQFATKLRAMAVMEGAGFGNAIKDYGFNNTDLLLAREIIEHVRYGRHKLAAALLHKMFFAATEEEKDGTSKAAKKAERLKLKEEPGPHSVPMGEVGKVGKEEGEPFEVELGKYYAEPKMEIIELPRVEPTVATTDGFRMATTGSRIYRPALRRPVLPQRLFMKRAPQEPAGTILFDASGSMGVSMERLLECCRHAPSANIAFYAGDGRKGYLWVFAAFGMRAREIPESWPCGNLVDGPAMDWMMAQDGPRIFVTDRQFCDAHDSHLQIVRLAQLEAAGEVTVYESYKEFQKEFATT